METSHGIPRDRDPSRAHPCRDRPRQGPGLRRAWWLYGAALFIVALPHAVLLQPDRQRVEKRQLDEGGKSLGSILDVFNYLLQITIMQRLERLEQ